MAEPSSPDPLDDPVRALRQEVESLRAEVRALQREQRASGHRADTSIVPDTDRRVSGIIDRRTWPDLESLVGRYGTVALAALLLVMAVGVLLSWAVRNIEFGPVTRVVLGALGAAALAGLGAYFRRRGSRPFGGALLAIALAIVHVDAWGAGESLHVVSTTTALGAAALASIALAALAWRERDQMLFMVGVGGALLAPFVTSRQTANVVPLLLYGWIVTACANYALRDRTRNWRASARLLAAGVAAYVLATLFSEGMGSARLLVDAPAVFALACAVTALAIGERHEPGFEATTAGVPWGETWTYLVISDLVVVAVSLGARRFGDAFPVDAIGIALAGTVVTYAGPWRYRHGRERWSIATIGLPLGFFLVAVAGLHHPLSISAGIVGAAWALLAGVGTPRERAVRNAARLVACVTAGYAVVAVAVSSTPSVEAGPFVAVVALSAVVAAFGVCCRGDRDPMLIVGPLLAAGAAALWSELMLRARPPFAYVPFGTRASAAALAAAAGWLALAWHVRAGKLADGTEGDPEGRVPLALAAAAVAVTFMWGHEELAGASSPDVATFLVILYFAGAGVAAIYAGRRVGIALARRAGLIVAVYAALKALYQTSDLANIGLRIGAYALVGCFLLGVAFWYRTAGEELGATGDLGLGAGTSP